MLSPSPEQESSQGKIPAKTALDILESPDTAAALRSCSPLRLLYTPALLNAGVSFLTLLATHLIVIEPQIISSLLTILTAKGVLRNGSYYIVSQLY